MIAENEEIEREHIMNIKYLGPSKAVIVHPYGEHRKDEIKIYPKSFAEELLLMSRKQRFISIDDFETSAKNDKGSEVTTATTKKRSRIKPDDKKWSTVMDARSR